MLWKCQQKRMINAGVSVDSSQHFSFPVALFQLKCVFYFLIFFFGKGWGLSLNLVLIQLIMKVVYAASVINHIKPYCVVW